MPWFNITIDEIGNDPIILRRLIRAPNFAISISSLLTSTTFGLSKTSAKLVFPFFHQESLKGPLGKDIFLEIGTSWEELFGKVRVGL